MSEYIVKCKEFVSISGAMMLFPEYIDMNQEIVRCRDCEHGIKADLSGNWYECMKPDDNGDYARWDVEPDGFCAWGIRKAVEQ